MNILDNEPTYNKYDEQLFKMPKHCCVSASSKQERAHFCGVCGIFMPGNGQAARGRKFYRSSHYSTQDPTKSNSNGIMSAMIRTQSNNRYYNANAPNLQSRGSLIEWMRALCQTLSYSESTCYLAISYLDAVLSLYVIKDNQLKLIGYVAVYVAAKMEEEDAKIPLIDEAVKLFKNEFTKADFTNCEMFLFRILNYNLSVKTPYSFLCFFFSKGIVASQDFASPLKEAEVERVVKQVEQLALLFLDLSLRYYDFYQFSAIAIATSALACARKCMSLPIWLEDLEQLSLVPWDSIKDSTALLFRLLRDSHADIYAQFFPPAAAAEGESKNFTPQKKSRGCFEIVEESTKERGAMEEDSTLEHSADLDGEKTRNCLPLKSFMSCSNELDDKQQHGLINEFQICDELSQPASEELDLENSFSNLIVGGGSFGTENMEEEISYRICNSVASEGRFI